MTNYQYIINLFTEVLKSSKAIRGRFHVAHRYALQEANYDQLGEVLNAIQEKTKYPMVVMAPPTSSLKIENGWEEFRIILYFVKTSFYGAGADISSKTKTSLHDIPQDWHDMKRCALNFMRVLSELQRNTRPAIFTVPPHQILCQPVSHVGADRASGVHINFDFKLFVGCDLEDYSEYVKDLKIDLDGHNEHDL